MTPTPLQKNRYSTLMISMHWLMAIVIIATYVAINLKGLFPKGSEPREAVKALHFMLGLTVLMLIFVRIYGRSLHAVPKIYPPLKAWQAVSSKIAHLLLYAFMIAMPILGWLILSAAGKPIPFFGLTLPALIAENKETAKSIKEIHETIGTLGYYLIGLHLLAALFHHFKQKDNTLIRMLPTFKK